MFSITSSSNEKQHVFLITFVRQTNSLSGQASNTVSLLVTWLFKIIVVPRGLRFAQMVERPPSMGEVPGSIPGFCNSLYFNNTLLLFKGEFFSSSLLYK